jgi:hypothetical protein
MLSLVRKSPAFFASAVAFGLLLGCGGEEEFTVDVSGEYSVSLSHGTTTCDIPDWSQREDYLGVPFSITQDDNQLHATITGVEGAAVAWLLLGTAEFDGTVKQTSLTLTNYGTISHTMGSCSFTYMATIDGKLTGDAISGTITYAPNTNGSPDCVAIKCEAVQNFSGSRPPK